jgi:hypothetical protein
MRSRKLEIRNQKPREEENIKLEIRRAARQENTRRRKHEKQKTGNKNKKPRGGENMRSRKLEIRRAETTRRRKHEKQKRKDRVDTSKADWDIESIPEENASSKSIYEWKQLSWPLNRCHHQSKASQAVGQERNNTNAEFATNLLRGRGNWACP